MTCAHEHYVWQILSYLPTAWMRFTLMVGDETKLNPKHSVHVQPCSSAIMMRVRDAQVLM